jgi:WD40 repeat protein
MEPGALVGPYEILTRLGAGGMGEVWRARDVRLGREVAIKVLPAGAAGDPERVRRFRSEARAVAALSHGNILALYDVGATAVSCRAEGGEPRDGGEEVHYLVTELLEGQTLEQRLRGGAVSSAKAIEVALQVASGLAAAHGKGIVHRDLKPANLFVTGDGTVKILDFGLARLTQPERAGAQATTATATGGVLGSPAYMSPEQAQGLPADHRADLFSLGVVLYEMLSGQRPFRGASTGEVTAAILRDDPAALPAAVPPALERIVRRCLEKRPDARFSSARDVAFALQAVADEAPRAVARRAGAERLYPGMAAFTEADAGRFFGRDHDIAAVWRKLAERSLLALIGPSGAGKTSFVRAGLVPHAPPGWRCVVATPGPAPFASLARALAPSFAGDADAVQQLLDLHLPDTATGLVRRWRQRCDHALVVVDQLEELFTLNPADVRQRFAGLLGALAALDGVHVLLSMRDDFLFGCHAFGGLAAMFDAVVPLGPPSSDGLRRALVEPARAMGFGFEDDGLVEDMVGSVAGERGALPLLAFAAASLWERRDEETRLLTRAAYEAIGGVSGALAQHAEATLVRIGPDRVELVRELFRNLVTAQGTRAVCDADELATVFPGERRAGAETTLAALVDARLLTEYEVNGADGTPRRRVEVVHESLLTAWPRLVRWRTEDEGGAQLRDQLRQAAHLWEEKGRPDDLLWTGTSFQEYQVWRARYPGGVSEVEEDFGWAMVARAGRRRRLRRAFYAGVLAAVVMIASGLGVLLRRSVRETRRAEAEARQREAAQLLALGRLKLADHPNAALAYAIASLERSDNGAARRFALEALWQGPSALFLSDPVRPTAMHWSPDGRWLALAGARGLAVFERVSGGRRQLSSANESIGDAGFTSDGQRLVTRAELGTLHVWALPAGRLERTLDDAGSPAGFAGDRLLTVGPDSRVARKGPSLVVRSLSLDGSTRTTFGEWSPRDLHGNFEIDPSGTSILSMQGDRLTQQRLDALDAPPRVFGSHEDASVWMQPWRDRVVTGGSGGEVRIWDVMSGRLERALKSPGDARLVALDPRRRFLATSPLGPGSPHAAFLFDLAAPPTAEPLLLPGNEVLFYNAMKFSPDGAWLASMHVGTAELWNMTGARSIVVGRQKPPFGNVAFTRDGDLLSASGEGVLRRWPLSAAAGGSVQVLWSRPGEMIGTLLEVDPRNRFVALTLLFRGEILRAPFDGSNPWIHRLKRPPGVSLAAGLGSLDPNGKWLAMAAFADGHPELNGIRLIDLDTGDERHLDAHPKGGERCEEVGSFFAGAALPVWLRDGRLVSDGDAGLRVWDIPAGTSRLLRPCRKFMVDLLMLASPDSRVILRLDPAQTTGAVSSLSAFDLVSGTTREVTSHGNAVECIAFDPSGRVLVTGGQDGVVRVGRLAGEETHLLFGHTAPVQNVAVSPDGRWIASASDDGTIRIWPMPDLTRPPLHTLPNAELLAKLRSLTNLRAVRDPGSDTGWKIEIGPFPGWAVVPEWQP